MTMAMMMMMMMVMVMVVILVVCPVTLVRTAEHDQTTPAAETTCIHPPQLFPSGITQYDN